MLENTNKALIVNTIVLYGKLLVTAICGLLTTRFTLQALGISDFGLFSVLGGIISFVAIVNTIMVATSNRFIAVEIGKGDTVSINEQFNISLIIHIAIAFITIIVLLPCGIFYVLNFVNYDGKTFNALLVFLLSAIASALSFVGVPYNGLLMAKERFVLFCTVDIFVSVAKMLVSYILLYAFQQKIIIYATTTAILTIFPAIVYIFYSKYLFEEITRFHFIKDLKKYKEILSFSGWVAYGAVACVAKAQGAALVINLFFNTAMNTALGLANSVNSYILLFAQNIEKPIAPQLTKSYAAGNKERTNLLLVLSTKLSYFAMLIVSAPFLIDCNWVLSLWLGSVPDYVELFTVLLIIDNLVNAFNSGIANVIFASGRIKAYQLSINSLRLLAVGFAYIVLKNGYPPHSLIITYIASSVVVIFTSQYILHKTLKYNNSILLNSSYLPSVLVSFCFIPSLYLKIDVHPFLRITILVVYLIILIYLVGLKRKEKDFVINCLHKIINRL